MRYINKFLFLSVIAALALTACEKIENLPYYEKGTAVTLTSSKTSVEPTLADSLSNVVTFSWTNPNYATDSSTYKFILEIDSSGRDFSKKTTKEVIGALSTALTGRELNNILLNYGFSLGTPYDLDLRVISSYSNNNERYVSNVVKISVTPYSDPSVLASAQTSVTLALATASQLSNNFSWAPSFSGYTGIVSYTIQYDSATKNFIAPNEIPIGSSIYTKEMTQDEMNITAFKSGIPAGNSGKVEYRVKNH